MRKLLVWGTVVSVLLLAIGLAVFEYRHQQGVQRAQQLFGQHAVEPLGDIGATRVLRILPLLEYHSSDPALATAVGVSYLVDTDDHRILYDVGQNPEGSDPSPLQSNMTALGVELATIDTVFISHNHFDHVGGLHWQNQKTFSLGPEQLPFPNPRTRLVMPELMTYPGLATVLADQPLSLGNGVGSTGLASTGAIGRQLVIGWIEEHSLVVNVEGLGGILIVACGHQPIPNLLQRYDEAFSEPLYGIIGGLHFPVPEGRIKVGPLDGQRRFASGDGLFSPLTMEEVQRQIGLMKARNLGVIGVSGHDSSDEVIAMVRREFGDTYRDVRVGETIEIRSPGSPAAN